jgi:hypothetical protein
MSSKVSRSLSFRLVSRESSAGLCDLGALVLSFLSHIAALSVRLARLAGSSAIIFAMAVD